jgi:hypothetical protein
MDDTVTPAMVNKPIVAQGEAYKYTAHERAKPRYGVVADNGVPSYFHSIFSRHVNSSFQPINVSFDRVSPTYYETQLPNCGDLIMNVYIKGTKVENIKTCTLYVNDETIQTMTGEYIYIHNYLRTPKQKSNLMDNSSYVIIPFKKNLPVLPGNKIIIELFSGADLSMVIDYMFLDTPPKPVDMLVEQVQIIDEASFAQTHKFDLGLKRLIKELIFVVQDVGSSGLNFSDQLVSMSIDINQFTKVLQSGAYFSRVQPMDYHTRIPEPPSVFYTYSFCLDPESEFPTGTINMGRIRNQVVTMKFTDARPRFIRVYAIGYNVIAPDGKLIFV